MFDYKIVENAVLNITASDLIDTNQEDPRLLKARSVMADREREVEGLKSRMNNLIEALEEGGARSIVERVAALEGEIENRNGQLATFRRLDALASSLPSKVDDAALVSRLRASLTTDDYDVRYRARTETNLALRRLRVEVRLTDDGRFTIALAEAAPMLLDKEGNRDASTVPHSSPKREEDAPALSGSVPMTEQAALMLLKQLAGLSR